MTNAPEENWPLQPERLRPPALPAQLLRASDADRNDAANLLALAFADGRLTRAEHDERLGRAMTAKTLGELAPLTHDLQPPAMPAATGPVVGVSAPSRTMVAIFSGGGEAGVWSVPATLNIVSVFGGQEIDLRDAVFESDVTDINITCLFGGVRIVVPPGTRVVKDLFAVFGGIDVKQMGQPAPGARTVRVHGLALFGGVAVQNKDRTIPPQSELRR